MNVLIADNEPISRRLLEVLLNRWGYDVTAASGGADAWRLLQAEEHPKIAILTWRLPDMDGIQVCRKLRQRPDASPTYILMLTDKQDSGGGEGGFQAGADDYLVKPFAPQELLARLRAAHRIIDLESRLQSAQDALSVESAHDPLTGLWNRSTILEFLQRELHRSRRQSSRVAVVMADVDRLQDINLRHGHLAGDAILRETSRRLRRSIRDYDTMGRYTGGQFVIVSPACDQTGALSQAERLRSCASKQPVATYEGALAVTLSFGVAAGSDEKHSDRIIAAAEGALAQAKKTGRDRVEVAVC